MEIASPGGINPSKDSRTTHYNFIVIGGGIAGVTCAEALSRLCEKQKHLLISASPLVKTVTNFKQVSKVLEVFDVQEKHVSLFEETCPNVDVIQTTVCKLQCEKKTLKTENGHRFSYDSVCICTGGQPKVISDDNPFVLGIRDTETVKVFQKKIRKAKRIVIVGNGGIATELAYEIEGCEVVWAIKDKSISHTFVDAGAAEFFLPQLKADKQTPGGPSKRLKYTLEEETKCGGKVQGNALGPDWSVGVHLSGTLEHSHKIHVEYQVEISRVLTPVEVQEKGINVEPFPNSKSSEENWPIFIELSNGKVYGCDFIVSATGVTPNTVTSDSDLKMSSGGGLCVNDHMQTSAKCVYAAGDVCSACWEPADHWIQMRLWSQARQMGSYAAKCMVAEAQGENVEMDFCFELFAHVTKFFNYKVVLLGKFNAQGLENNHELLVRVTKGTEYVKLVLSDGRVQGAVLIGETDLEETIENLILNRLDVTPYKDHLLDPNIDIEDFFD